MADLYDEESGESAQAFTAAALRAQGCRALLDTHEQVEARVCDELHGIASSLAGRSMRADLNELASPVLRSFPDTKALCDRLHALADELWAARKRSKAAR